MTDLPRRVVDDDHRLERAASSASEELARLRWHWTLDETNPGRVSLRAYARAVGRDARTITVYAQGYVRSSGDADISLTEAIERSSMSSDREAATEAVAKARGLAITTVRQNRPTEVRRVLGIARDRVEQHGGSLADAARETADWIVRSEQTSERREAERRQRTSMRLIEVESHLDGARRRLEQALQVARSVEWGDEEQGLLQATIANVRALLGLIDVALAGTPDVDWDAELAALRSGD
jgi:hypothetical protein